MLVKIVCQVEWNGDLFEGVVINPGVNVSLEDACVEGDKYLKLVNGDKDVSIMYAHIKSVSIGEGKPLNFLDIFPAE